MNSLKSILAKLQSRTTLFCLGFFVCGNVLQWQHRLDATYLTFMSALMGFVLTHSVKEDYFNSGQTKQDSDAA